jgi:RNA-directed DNA polymerase
VQPRLRSASALIRYCDDFVLHPEKTRLVDFRAPAERVGAETTLPTTFTFLGFLHIWSKTRTGRATVWQRTAKDRLERALKAINQQCRFMRPWPITDAITVTVTSGFDIGIASRWRTVTDTRRLADW